MRTFLVGVIFVVTFAMGAVAQSASASSDVQANWQSIDQLCGRLELSTPRQKHIIVDGKSGSRLYTTFLEGATLTLYPGTPTEHECCAVKPIATTESRKFGVFQFDGAHPGAYWLRVHKNEFVRLIAIRVTENFDAKQCQKPWVDRRFVVDSNPPKVEKRIQ